MAELRASGLGGEELHEEAMGTMAAYEELLAEQHEQASETFAALQEDVQTAGYSWVDLKELLGRDRDLDDLGDLGDLGQPRAPSDAAGGGSAGAPASASCRRWSFACSRGSPTGTGTRRSSTRSRTSPTPCLQSSGFF